MQIKEYLKTSGEKPYKFAQRAGVRFETIYLLHNGGKPNLTAKVLQKIVIATGGKVSLEDLL